MANGIVLSSQERQLKDLLVAAAAHIDKQASDVSLRNEPLTLRWAGGWVRDKLLGTASHDIDVAINTMTGETFALGLVEFCADDANRAAYGVGPDDLKHLQTVKKNPERSKHLETAMTRLFGLDLDFVNLRKETYTTDSRNPQIEFGTPQEDALRRDATVNALFYNIHSNEVEDYTTGLADMANKLIRTPLEPLQTFLDDPLRVLRLVRFASRLQFRIDETTEQFMGAQQVLESLRVKISRERVGVELEKMLRGKYPLDSLALIDRLKLYHAVFTDPTRESMPQPDISNWSAVYECLDFISRTQTPGSIYDQLVRGGEARWLAWTLAALTPWEQVKDAPPPKPGKPMTPMSYLAAREGFKASNKLTDILISARRHRPAIMELKHIVDTNGDGLMERDRFGMAVREWDPKGGWRLQVLSAIFVDVLQRTAGQSGEDRNTILAEWQRFLDHLVALDVTEAPSIKRLVDGTFLAKELGVRPGKWMSAALDVVMVWQLRNPESTDTTGAVDEVRKRKKELGIDRWTMGSFENLRAVASKLRESAAKKDALAALADAVPEAFSLQDLGREIVAARSGQDPRATVLALLACLREDGKVRETNDNSKAAQQLVSFVASAMAPIAESDDDSSDSQHHYKRVVSRSRSIADAGMEAIMCLAKQEPLKLNDQVLVTLVAYANAGEAWATPETSRIAVELLREQFKTTDQDKFMSEIVLKSYLRALFSKSRPATVTASGRKAEFVDRERETGLPDESRETKPWKYGDFRAVPVFSWAVEEASESLMTQHWPLFIPVLLTLVDDSSTRFRARGLEILASFLKKFPGKKLRETGLAIVFEQAIFPTLLYLPSLTPVDESLQLLEPAYNALFALAEHSPGPDNIKDRDRLLDKIIREGIFTAYLHAKDHVRIVELLFRQTVLVVGMMGINSVKHLKDLIPMVSSVMTDPFAASSSPTLLAAIAALQAILSNAWPRISDGPWKDEILKTLVITWLNVQEDPKPAEDRIAAELIKTTNMLSTITKTAHSSLVSHAAPLVSKDPTLAPLFAGSS
ncbi:poly A polymerase C-terminal region-like protein [Thozetella sp. PMI_491]|nr:poly A polymerase C-terminal region-like protein [Thozetella sp. PMI_491]